MNLERLFEVQKKLDDHIIQKKGLKGQDLLAKKILALLVELGELANEWRGFKFWSNDQEPRTRHVEPDIEYFDKTREARWKESNPLLEEYVDCLHFILSIGLDLDTTNIIIDSDYTGADATETFIIAFETVIELANAFPDGKKPYIYQVYEELFNLFVGLGEKYLGFKWEEVEKAYMEKNKRNHERQENGY